MRFCGLFLSQVNLTLFTGVNFGGENDGTIDSEIIDIGNGD